MVVDETPRTSCPKCNAVSGDDWRQCRGFCPMPCSPHFPTEDQLRTRLTYLRTILETRVELTRLDRFPADYHTPRYRGRWQAYLELPECTRLTFDSMFAMSQHLGTTEINFESAFDNGYYGDIDNIVRLWVCW